MQFHHGKRDKHDDDNKEIQYGFNGKEKDSNGEFGNTTYDYGFRIYNPAIGKFLSVDPLMSSFPFYTPYQFSANNPIASIDLDGLEAVIKINSPWFKNEIEKAINTKTVEGNERASFLAFHSITVDRPPDKKGSAYVHNLYGGEGFAGTFNHSEDNQLGLTVLDQDNNELFSIAPDLTGGASEEHWYDPVLEFLGVIEDRLGEKGSGFVFTTESGLTGQLGHVRKGEAEREIEIDLLMAAIGAAGSAATNRQVLFPGKNAKGFAEGFKQVFEAAQIVQSVESVLDRGLEGEVDTNQNFLCPSCTGLFPASDTAEHNRILRRESGPFKPQRDDK